MLRRLRVRIAEAIVSRLPRLPDHVAIIPDGNRRWARRRGLPPWAGHLAGYKAFRRVVDFLWDHGVRVITVYVMSRENCLRRSGEEREKIVEVIRAALEDLRRDWRYESGELGFHAAGDFTLLPPSLAEELESMESRGRVGQLTACICYSGEWEIAEMIGRAASTCTNRLGEPRRVIEEYTPLKLPKPPDLLIRSGGELRLSNFLLPHLAYTELYFTKTLWPDFDELEAARALRSYSKRSRRFGA